VRRSFAPPFPVDADMADATFTDGILRVTLPEAQTAKPKKITATGDREEKAIAHRPCRRARNRSQSAPR